MENITYRKVCTKDILEISTLHLNSLQDGLLYKMGEKYISIFYKIGLKSKNLFGYVALNPEKKVIGAAIATKNIDHLLLRMLINPYFLFGLLKILFKIRSLYPMGGEKIPIKQEFILFFVDLKYRNLYIALKLMDLIEKNYSTLGFNKYSLEVKENNLAANKLYNYFGFVKGFEVGKGENKRIFYTKEISPILE